MSDVYETDLDAINPWIPLADSLPVVGAAAVKIGVTQMADERGVLVVEKDRDAKVDPKTGKLVPDTYTEEPLTIVEEEIFDGLGGFVAVEDRKRGLMKAFGGDKIVRLSNGQGYVVPAEVLEATPVNPVTSAQKREAAEKLRFKQEKETREFIEKQRQEEENRRLGISTKEVKKEEEFPPLGVEPAKSKK